MKITKREMLEEILLNQKFIMQALTYNTTRDDADLDDLRIRITETTEVVKLSRE